MTEIQGETQSKESSLEAFQNALVELLTSGLPERKIIETLKNDTRFEEYQDYLEQFDLDMVAVASELMSKWAKWKTSEQ